jgi:cytoskeleton protein RodZ
LKSKTQENIVEIGTKLQQARIGKGFTLTHISNVTKMSSHVLQLIETNDFARLPGGLLTRGYLRAFASEVGLDPEEIVHEYRAEFESASAEDEPFKLRSSYQDKEPGIRHAGLMLIIGFAILIYFAYPRPVQRPSEMEIAADTAEIDVDGARAISTAVAASAHSAQIAPPPVAAADSEGLQIELRPQAECWLSAVADGHLVLYRLMQGGERETINARDEILLRVGDAGTLTYFVNGEGGRSLGASGEAVSIRITSDNSATWLTNEARRRPADDINGAGESATEAQEIISSTRQATGI